MIQQLGNELVPVLAIVCTFLFLAIWVVAATIDSMYKTATSTRLKERLIERGASASEIDMVLKAGASPDEWSGGTEPVPPVKTGAGRAASSY